MTESIVKWYVTMKSYLHYARLTWKLFGLSSASPTVSTICKQQVHSN